jgi:WD40 repeat protein
VSQLVTRSRERPDRALSLSLYPAAMGWAAGGGLLAVGGDGGEVVLIDAAAGTAQRVLRAHAGPVQSLAWHPRREALLTTGQDGAARVWEPPYEAPRELIAPSAQWADHACWSPKGDRAAVAVGVRAHVLAGASVVVTEPAASTIAGLAFAPSGKSLGIACYGGVSLHDPGTGRVTRKLAWKGSMISLVFSPDGTVVACGCQDQSVHFWRIASGKDAQMSGYPAKPRSLSFSHDGQWLATAGDAAICLWPFDRRGPEGRPPVQLAAHADLVTEVAYAPLVELLLSGSRDGSIAMWAPPKLTAPVRMAQLGARIAHVAWGADGRAQQLRWAAADERGNLLIGQL